MLAISAIHLYSKNYFVLKDYYTGVLALKTTYESAEHDYLELDCGATKLVIQKSIRDVQNKIRITFKTEDVKAYQKTTSGKQHRSFSIENDFRQTRF
jgi:ABC-type molybdate transport system ATPase subunit